jgi:hypothetical protein
MQMSMQLIAMRDCFDFKPGLTTGSRIIFYFQIKKVNHRAQYMWLINPSADYSHKLKTKNEKYKMISPIS